MSDSVTERTIAVIAKYRKVAPETIKAETTFEELKIDSLDGINLVFELEEEFNISIPDDKALSMRSVGQVIEGITLLLSGEGAADIAKPVETEG